MSTHAISYSKEDLDILLQSDDPAVAKNALLYLCFNIDDPEWIQVKCVQVVQNHQSDDVRGLALTCIGHVARMHKTINKVLVIPVLLKGLKHNTLSGRAQDALDDIDIYVQGSNLKNGG
jgi:hypothetical protein